MSKKIKLGFSIYLTGDLGSGKTTFSRFLIQNLFKSKGKRKPEVTSPTYNIVQYYNVSNKFIIAHYDLYRMKNSIDIDQVGLYELEEKVCSIIEWPKLIKQKNKNRIEINFMYTKFKNKRNVKIKYFGSAKE